MSQKPYERFILSRSEVVTVRQKRLLKKAAEQLRRTVKCIVCDMGSVASLVRVDRVPHCSASLKRDAQKPEYVHGLCVDRLRKKYPAPHRSKHHIEAVPLYA